MELDSKFGIKAWWGIKIEEKTGETVNEVEEEEEHGSFI